MEEDGSYKSKSCLVGKEGLKVIEFFVIPNEANTA